MGQLAPTQEILQTSMGRGCCSEFSNIIKDISFTLEEKITEALTKLVQMT